MTTYPQGSYEIIDHTADVGILVTSPTLGGIFEVAALAFTDLITGVEGLNLRVEHKFQLQADELEILLVSWLQELLYLLETEGLVFGRFRVNLRNSQLEARAWGETFDPKIHAIKTQIKAITYHQLRVAASEQGWQAQVIFDI